VNIIEYALKMEKDGEAYYRDLAVNAENKSIEEIFNILADAEAQHYEAFLQLRDNLPIPPVEEETLSQVKNIFQQMQLRKEKLEVDESQVEAYKKARNIEKESRDFYLQKAGELADPMQKSLCLKMAAEEKQHYIILCNIIDFMSKPDTWLEDAEWHHMDEY